MEGVVIYISLSSQWRFSLGKKDCCLHILSMLVQCLATYKYITYILIDKLLLQVKASQENVLWLHDSAVVSCILWILLKSLLNILLVQMNKKLQQLKAPKRKQLQATKLSVEGRGMVKYLWSSCSCGNNHNQSEWWTLLSSQSGTL